MGCDANAHHIVWGSTNCNPQGDSLLDFILTSNLLTANRGNELTFNNSARNEVLDIKLCSMHIAYLIKDWKVTNKILTSDQRCITFHINTDHTEPCKIKNPRSTNWDKFTDHLRISLPEAVHINSIPELDDIASKVSNAMEESFLAACPPQTIKRADMLRSLRQR